MKHENDSTDPKYYAPSIEEFYFGFEFEYWNESLDEPAWEKKVYPDPWFDEQSGWIEVNRNRLIEGVRVKLLDTDDIEKCGWFETHREQDNPNIMYYDTATESHSLIWNYIGRCIITIRDEVRQEDYTAFVGTIRNISELKRVMAMIGVKTGK